MPPAPNLNDELSLRHLPDMSDSSFSFQIPGTSHEINLLADDGLDFFRGVDVSRGAPQVPPPRANNRPLTIHDLTPRPLPDTNMIEHPEGMAPSSHQGFQDLKPKPEKMATRLQRPGLSKRHTKVMSNLWPVTPSLAHLPPAEGTSSTARMTTLRADIDPLTQELHVSPLLPIDQELTGTDDHGSKGATKISLEKDRVPMLLLSERREKLPRDKQKVIEGGITKARTTSKFTERHFSGHSSRSIEGSSCFPSSQQPSPSEDLNGDDTTADMSMGPGRGAAVRLVQYSQNLINSFGVYNSALSVGTRYLPILESHVKMDTNAITDVAPTKNGDDADTLLTLSQISPRKCPSRVETYPTPPANIAISPLRSASKRPAPVASEGLRHKKSRTVASSTANTASSSNTTRGVCGARLVAGSSTREISLPSSSRQPAVEIDIVPKRTTHKASTIRGNKLSGNSARAMTKSTSASSSVSSSRSTMVLRESRRQRDATKPPVLRSSLKGKSKAPSASIMPERPMFQIPPLDSAKPTPFQSLTELRLLTHKDRPRNVEAEAQSQSQSHSQREKKCHVAIPDFKAKHAAQEAKLALLKENIHPTLPQPMRLVTDQRVIERQKFDDMVKEKQCEQEQLLEEKRKEREEQEERELRELRKKTIPKANVVPEWYKGAPKKKDKYVDSLGR